jgi:cytochrome c553
MIKATKILPIAPPAGYQKKYLLEYLVDLKALQTGSKEVTIMEEIVKALSKDQETKMGLSMLYKYKAEKKGGKRQELSETRKKIIAQYFGLSQGTDIMAR